MQLTQWANCTTRLHVLCDRSAGDNFLDGSVSTIGKRSLPFLPQTTFPNRVIRHPWSRPDNTNLFSLVLIILSAPYSNTFRRVSDAASISISIRKFRIVIVTVAVVDRSLCLRSSWYRISPRARIIFLAENSFVVPWPPRDGGSHRCEKWLWEFRVTSPRRTRARNFRAQFSLRESPCK